MKKNEEIIKNNESKSLKYRKGKGETEGYKTFCRNCHLEFLVEAKTCQKCHQVTMSRDDRISELEEKVEILKGKYEERQKRREKWDAYKKNHKTKNTNNTTDYDVWDKWEPEIDHEEFLSGGAQEKGPQFMALEKDLEERAKKSKELSRLSTIEKEKGNVYFKKQNYKMALDHYDKALGHSKTDKSLWTNHALVCIKLERYEKAIEDCTRCLEYSEFIENNSSIGNSEYKAYIRRACAYRYQNNYKKSLSDLNTALKLFPKKNKQTQKLVNEYTLLKNDMAKLKDLESKQENERKVASVDVSHLDTEQKCINFIITQPNNLDKLYKENSFELINHCCEYDTVLRHVVHHKTTYPNIMNNFKSQENNEYYFEFLIKISHNDTGRQQLAHHNEFEKFYFLMERKCILECNHSEESNLTILAAAFCSNLMHEKKCLSIIIREKNYILR
eukprot:UN32775